MENKRLLVLLIQEALAKKQCPMASVIISNMGKQFCSHLGLLHGQLGLQWSQFHRWIGRFRRDVHQTPLERGLRLEQLLFQALHFQLFFKQLLIHLFQVKAFKLKLAVHSVHFELTFGLLAPGRFGPCPPTLLDFRGGHALQILLATAQSELQRTLNPKTSEALPILTEDIKVQLQTQKKTWTFWRFVHVRFSPKNKTPRLLYF